MKITDTIVVCTTKYDTDLVSKNRIECTKKTLQSIKDLQLQAVIVDGGSTNIEFLQILESYKSDLITIVEGSFGSHGEQIRKAFSIAQENYGENECEILYTEPEKDSLFSKENIERLQSYQEQGGYDQFLNIMRPTDTKMPYPQFITETIGAQKINNKIDAIILGNSSKTLDEFTLHEGPGSFAGPFISTLKGVEKIINTEAQSTRDGNEFLYVARMRSYLEGIREEKRNVTFMRLSNFKYSEEHEINPENAEWEKFITENGGQEKCKKALLSTSSSIITKFGKGNPTSLVHKRNQSLKYILESMKKEIQKNSLN